MKRAFIFALLVTMLTACMQDSITEEGSTSSRPEYIYATFEEDTRVELNESKKTVWTEGDQIVRIGQDAFDVWTFMGKTGDRSGSFSLWATSGYRFNYDFEGKYYALYSYANFYNAGTFSDGAPAPMYFVRAVQNYKANTYDPESNIMLGVSDDGSNFKFRNLMGYLRLSLTGDKCVSYITLSGNNNEYLNGVRYVRCDSIDVGSWYADVSYTTTLQCDGVQLSDTPTEFYFTLAPTLFTNGISVEVHFTDGTMHPISTTKSVNIERNTIQPMATVNTGCDVKWQTIIIKHSGSKATSPRLLGESNLVGMVYWGDGFMSDATLSGSYVYDDGLSEHQITVKSQNATYLYINGCEGISEIDLTNF